MSAYLERSETVNISSPGSCSIAGSPGGTTAITGVATSTALFIGWAPQGPTDRALHLVSFSDYQRNYGGLDAGSLLGHCIRHFYANGGRDAYVLRITGDGGAAVDPGDVAFLKALGMAFDAGGAADQIDRFNLVCVPGLADAAAIRMLQRHARERRAFLILDGAECADAVGIDDSIAAITGADAINAALYFPWVRAPDPLQQDALRLFPPCGFVAGIFARTDAARGVWKAPAGTDASLTGAAGPGLILSEAETARLSARGVNGLRVFPSGETVVWSARTLGEGNDPQWRYIPVRRTALFLEQSMYSGTQWAAFESNDAQLWQRLRLDVETFMQGLFRQGAFQGTTPNHAYFVKCDSETTTQADIVSGVVNVVIGFAPLKPAEFVVIRIQQIAGATAD
ncbi:MAG: phage tail sheath C-terminal domain-containing protein [Bradyrhizobium sp.]